MGEEPRVDYIPTVASFGRRLRALSSAPQAHRESQATARPRLERPQTRQLSERKGVKRLRPSTNGRVFALNTTVPRPCTQQQQSSNSVVICTYARNVAWALNEWLVYHVWSVGVSHVAFYDANSTDNTRAVLRPWIAAGLVTHHPWQRPSTHEGLTQSAAYAHCWHMHHTEHTWVAFLDPDEWLLPLHTQCLPSLMQRYANASSLAVQRYAAAAAAAASQSQQPRQAAGLTVFEAVNFTLGAPQPLVRPVCHSQHAQGPTWGVPHCCDSKPGYHRVDERNTVRRHATDTPCWMPGSDHMAPGQGPAHIAILHVPSATPAEHMRLMQQKSGGGTGAAGSAAGIQLHESVVTRMQGLRELLSRVLIGWAQTAPTQQHGKAHQQQGPGHWVNPDPVKWPGGFYSLPVDEPRTLNQSAADNSSVGEQYKDKPGSCFDIAAQAPNPMSDVYAQPRRPPSPLPGGGHRSFFRWEGNITRELYDTVPMDLRGPKCVHGGPAVRYQIIGGHLYRQDKDVQSWTQQAGEGLLLTTLHLFAVPDMDVMVHYGDSCPPNGTPALSWNICRDRPQAGFAFPSYTAWSKALGVEQTKVYHQCLNARYSHTHREPKVLWRGSSTDPYTTNFPNMSYVDKVLRMRLHTDYVNDTYIDAKLVQALYAAPEVEAYLKKAQPFAPRLPLEDYNKAAVILDVDGNAWSDRLSMIVHFPTPLLKQASNHTAFFEHLLVPGREMEYIAYDARDLRTRAKGLVEELRTKPERLMRSVRRRQAVAMQSMHTVAVAEATAYALVQYKQRTAWKMVRDPTYTYVPFSKGCDYQGQLPRELCQRMALIPQPAPQPAPA